MRIAARNEPGKCADAVSTVPSGKVTQVFFYRIVQAERNSEVRKRSISRSQALHALLLRRRGRCCCGYVYLHGLKVEVNGVPLTVFHLVQHGVEAEFIPSFQEFLQPEGGFLLFTETAFFTETFHFPVSVAKSCTDGFCVRCVKIVHQRALYGFLLRGCLF